MADITSLDNKCPACNAKIVWNPEKQLFVCDYCASSFNLDEMQRYNNASTLENNVKVDLQKITSKDNMDIYRCKNCGAEIMADETVTATFCVYCGSTAILKQKIDNGFYPNLIIPFKNKKEDAIEAFKKVVKKPLTPSKFKNPENIQKITGIYIPFWAYDVETNGSINFHCTDVRSWSDNNYHYTETTTYNCEVSEHLEFNKVLADGSSRFPDDLMDSLEPFDYNDLIEYNHAYLSGFLAEKYDIDENVSFGRAKQRSMNTSIEMAKEATRHETKVVTGNNLDITNKKCYYIMLPVWMVTVKYNNKDYIFAMNGDTGKIVGNIPVGFKEFVFWLIIVFLITFGICSLIVLGGVL